MHDAAAEDRLIGLHEMHIICKLIEFHVFRNVYSKSVQCDCKSINIFVVWNSDTWLRKKSQVTSEKISNDKI